MSILLSFGVPVQSLADSLFPIRVEVCIVTALATLFLLKTQIIEHILAVELIVLGLVIYWLNTHVNDQSFHRLFGVRLKEILRIENHLTLLNRE